MVKKAADAIAARKAKGKKETGQVGGKVKQLSSSWRSPESPPRNEQNEPILRVLLDADDCEMTGK